MSFIAVSNVLEVTPTYAEDGKEFVNVLKFQRAGGWTVEDMNQVADAVFTWFSESGKQLINEQARMVGVRVTDLSSAVAPSFLVPAPTVVVGTLPGAPLGLNTACSITLGTDGRGRSRRGRIYQGGLATSALANARTIGAGYRGVANTVYEQFAIIVADAVPCTQVIVSYVTDGASNIPPDTHEVTTWNARAPIANMRRRL